MNKEQLRDFFEEHDFKVWVDDEFLELETWTDNGVNMIIRLESATPQSFYDYVNNFDVDEEVDVHRQGEDYRRDFSLKKALDDFTIFQVRLKDVAFALGAEEFKANISTIVHAIAKEKPSRIDGFVKREHGKFALYLESINEKGEGTEDYTLIFVVYNEQMAKNIAELFNIEIMEE